ncbi:MAG: isoprenyl transferase [Muribaculaceae bacterium]|nr:isoprenyl transferase [Muribaculaceae bacterium]
MLTEKEIHDVPETQLDMSRLPQHIAIIMDGNGRWAQARGMERAAGHVEGVTTVRRITEECSRLGIGYLTLYAFSTENWNRPQAEVDALMHLIATAIERETPDLIKNNVRLRVIGDRSRMPADTLARLERCVRDTSGGSGLTLVLAISYSSRWEITDAARRIAAEAAAGRLDPASITDDTVARNLATAFMPDPDLLIRTGGDMRVSNFLLWQIAYSEIYITDIYWPDFNAYDLRRAISDYQSRQRRFGLTGEQVQ